MKDNWEKMPEHLFSVSAGLLNVLIMHTKNAQEAAIVLAHMYMMLWRLAKTEDSNLEDMLSSFCKLIRGNTAMDEAEGQTKQ